MIAAQKVNRSNVRIEKAFSPKINLGIGVVPPVPNMNNIKKDKPKKRRRLLNILYNIYGKINNVIP